MADTYTLADLMRDREGVSEFDLDPRERRRQRMLASGMPDPNLPWGDFNRQTLGNFGRFALGMVPGVGAGVDAYNAYQEDRPVMAGVHAARGVAELALPPVMGRWSRAAHQRRIEDAVDGFSAGPAVAGRGVIRRSNDGPSPGGPFGGWGLPGIVNGPGLYGIRPERGAIRDAMPVSEYGPPVRARAREAADQMQQDYYSGVMSELAAGTRTPGTRTAPPEPTPQQTAVRESLQGVRPRQLERDGNLVIQNEPAGVGNGPNEGLPPEYLRALRAFWRMQKPDRLNSALPAVGGGLAAYFMADPDAAMWWGGP